jgi:hypothetical protein
LSLLLILVPAVGIVIAILFELRRSPRKNQVLSKILEVFVVIAVVIVVYGGVFLSRNQVETKLIQWRVTGQSHESQIASRPVEPAISEMEKSSDVDARPVSPSAELPEWTRKTSSFDGANTFVVVKSGRFATLDEAELHAFDEAGQAAARHFRQFDPSGVGECGPLQRQMVRDSAIRDRFEEISRHDFGTMKDFPMHQVWLRVELNTELGQRFAEPWRQATVAARLHTLTVASIWGTAAAALIAFALRLDAAWNGRRRAVIVGTAAALMLGSLAFLA